MMKTIIFICCIFFMIGCTANKEMIPHQETTPLPTTNTEKTTLVLKRVDNIMFFAVKTWLRVCGQNDLVELNRGESKQVEIPVGKCLISTNQGWHSGSYSIEINAEKEKISTVRISPRTTHLLLGGLAGQLIEKSANKGKSGPFELIEEK